MGVYVSTATSGGVSSMKLGTNGSQVMLCGYLFAAYAVASMPESNRVCAWVAPGWSRRAPMDANAPVPTRNQPRTVAALIAYSSDDDGDGVPESGYCLAQNDTIDLGLKFKPATDPVLRDLVTLWRAANEPSCQGLIDPATARRISGHMAQLIPHLETSESWYETMCDVAEIFHAAAATSAGVSIG